MSFILDNDEAIIYKKKVTYKNSSNVLLTITSKRLVFEKKRLFIDKYKVIDTFLMNDIILYKDQVQIKQRNKTLLIQTTKKLLSIKTDSIIDSTKIKEEIIKIKTGNNIIERNSLNLKKLFKKTNNLLGEVVLIGASAYGIAKNGKKIYEVGKKTIKYLANAFINK